MLRPLLILLCILSIIIVAVGAIMIRMPGTSYSGPLEPLTVREITLRNELKRDVEKIACEIGERNVFHYEGLLATADFIEASLMAAGYEVRKQGYGVQGRSCYNLEVEITGAERPDEIVIIGGHYDSIFGSPGANDNATGVAAVLALARAFAQEKPSRTLRFVAFVNEEPPYFQTSEMGSVVYAKDCRQRGEKVVAMLSLETIGYYTEGEGSQGYPLPLSLFYPSTGNFIGFVGNISSRRLVRDCIASFRRHTQFPSEGAALPGIMPGVGWSDQWAFWRQGYPAVMVTDTAPYRYPYYHSVHDTPERVHHDHLARVVAGLERVVADLVGSSS